MVTLPWTPELRRSLERWLQEDLGCVDLSAPVVGDVQGDALWLSKEPGCFCGGPLAAELVPPAEPGGAGACGGRRRRGPGMELLRLHGPAADPPGGGTPSGGATGGQRHPRKTTPGLRLLGKDAVRCGGGLHHRMGLDDAVMLKENHLTWCGGLAPALQRVRRQAPWPVSVMVEAETDAEAKAAVAPKLRHRVRQRGKTVMQNWHSLSDEATENELIDIGCIRHFAGIDLLTELMPPSFMLLPPPRTGRGRGSRKCAIVARGTRVLRHESPHWCGPGLRLDPLSGHH